MMPPSSSLAFGQLPADNKMLLLSSASCCHAEMRAWGDPISWHFKGSWKYKMLSDTSYFKEVLAQIKNRNKTNTCTRQKLLGGLQRVASEEEALLERVGWKLELLGRSCGSPRSGAQSWPLPSSICAFPLHTKGRGHPASTGSPQPWPNKPLGLEGGL